MYRPLPDGLTIKNSPIEGLGLFSTINIKKNTFIGITHIRDEQFENKYIRTPLGGFYNHSNEPTVIRMVTDVLPKLKFGDKIDINATVKKFQDGDKSGENLFYNLHEKSDAKYFFMVSVQDIKADEELTAQELSQRRNMKLYSPDGRLAGTGKTIKSVKIKSIAEKAEENRKED